MKEEGKKEEEVPKDPMKKKRKQYGQIYREEENSTN